MKEDYGAIEHENIEQKVEKLNALIERMSALGENNKDLLNSNPAMRREFERLVTLLESSRSSLMGLEGNS